MKGQLHTIMIVIVIVAVLWGLGVPAAFTEQTRAYDFDCFTSGTVTTCYEQPNNADVNPSLPWTAVTSSSFGGQTCSIDSQCPTGTFCYLPMGSDPCYGTCRWNPTGTCYSDTGIAGAVTASGDCSRKMGCQFPTGTPNDFDKILLDTSGQLIVTPTEPSTPTLPQEPAEPAQPGLPSEPGTDTAPQSLTVIGWLLLQIETFMNSIGGIFGL